MMTSMKPVTGRDIAALLNPRLAVLVTCCDTNGQPNVLTVAWHTPLSHQPPLVGISVGQTRYSNHLIQSQGEFVINIMDAAHQNAVEICGTWSGGSDDKLAIVGLQTRPAMCVCPPVLTEALGVLECRVVQQIKTGDHTFFIGEILQASACAANFSDAWENHSEHAVLQCLQRKRYGTFVEINENGQRQ